MVSVVKAEIDLVPNYDSLLLIEAITTPLPIEEAGGGWHESVQP